MTYLNRDERFSFPDPRDAPAMGIVAVGGNLSPGMVLSAYEQGIFPWYDRDPIAWFSPDPRFVLPVDEFHVRRRLRRELKRCTWTVTFDTEFEGVIDWCRTIPRSDQDGTWITGEMRTAYVELNRLGYAHSVEVWEGADGKAPSLAGGLYGVAVGSIFAGESIFSRRSGAGKVAVVALAELMRRHGVPIIDCQVHTPLLESFGAREVAREWFLDELSVLSRGEAVPASWKDFDGEELLSPYR